jgi:hypothetical protein
LEIATRKDMFLDNVRGMSHGRLIWVLGVLHGVLLRAVCLFWMVPFFVARAGMGIWAGLSSGRAEGGMGEILLTLLGACNVGSF